MNQLKKLINILSKEGKTIAVAESCSGGYASYLLTKIPGSSKVFKGGTVVYSLDAKKNLFRIPHPILVKSQGVSEKVALLLSKKIRTLFKADIGGSIVGFAGPTSKKHMKVGTVLISVSDGNTSIVKKLMIEGNRDQVRKKASMCLITLIYNTLLKK